MEKKFKNKILNEDFSDWNALEKEEFNEYFSDESEYNSVKELFEDSDKYVAFTAVKPNAKTKESLDNLFATKQVKTIPIWYNSVFTVLYPRDKTFIKRPLIQIAAVVLLALIFIPLVNNSSLINNDKNLLAQNENIESTDETLKSIPEFKKEVEKEVNTNTENDKKASDKMVDISSNAEMTRTDMKADNFTLQQRSESRDEAAGSTLASPSVGMASFSKAGRNADLFPVTLDDKLAKTPQSVSGADQADVLDLLTAAF